MKNKIVKCLIALGLSVGLLAGSAVPAMATPNPSYGTWLNTSDLWPSSDLHCWLTFSQGMDNGHPYAKIKRNLALSPTGGYFPGCATSTNSSKCTLTVSPTINNVCFITLEITYRTGPTSYFSKWVNLPFDWLNQSWVQVEAPVTASFVDSRIYTNAYASSFPATDPAVADNNPSYTSLVTLNAWFNAS